MKEYLKGITGKASRKLDRFQGVNKVKSRVPKYQNATQEPVLVALITQENAHGVRREVIKGGLDTT